MLMLQSDAEQTGTKRTLALQSDAELTKEMRMLAGQSGTEWTKFQRFNQMESWKAAPIMLRVDWSREDVGSPFRCRVV